MLCFNSKFKCKNSFNYLDMRLLIIYFCSDSRCRFFYGCGYLVLSLKNIKNGRIRLLLSDAQKD